MYIGLKTDDSIGAVWGKNYERRKVYRIKYNIKNVYGESNHN